VVPSIDPEDGCAELEMDHGLGGSPMDAAATLKLHTGRRMPVFGLGTWEVT
jgi:hypothetical protein